ncbi:MAG: hypothetical protein NVS4B9_37560 [Ktedonobacteraceae bacterium]
MDISHDEEGRAALLRHELVEYLKKQGHIRTARVEQAFRAVPRHLFLPDVELQTVYSDTYVTTKLEGSVPISSSSQPAIMAYMLEELALQSGQRVLEIGAGTGYNAALMAHIVGESGQVVTIDIDEDIVQAARAHLRAAGLSRVQVLCADGSAGHAELAPYDRLILTVSADDIAPAWREQLRRGGILVLPFKFTRFIPLLYLPSLLPPIDQVVLSLKNVGDHLQSISMHGGGFMPLRGTFAIQPGSQFLLNPELSLTLKSAQGCDWQGIARHMQGAYSDLSTGLRTTYTDLWGLRTWLTLREAAYCEISVTGSAEGYQERDSGGGGRDGGGGMRDHDEKYANIPSIARQLDGSMASYGLCLNDNISLLMRSECDPSGDTDYWLEPFELIIRSFPPGPLAQRLLAQVRAWHEAGRPFQWHQWGMLQNIKVRVYPLTSRYQPGPNELLSIRKGSRFIFAW